MPESTWHAFDIGSTFGQKGTASGETLRDEEHALGARITLEQNTNIAPFAITCAIYGWMVHTRFFGAEDEAMAEYDKMKSAISEIIKPFSDPAHDDRRATEKAIEAFVESFP
jgi:hypothetical protein